MQSLGQGLGPNTGARARPVKGRAGCWVREGVAPSRCEGPEVSTRGKFLKTQMLNPAFWWLLLWNFLSIENYMYVHWGLGINFSL